MMPYKAPHFQVAAQLLSNALVSHQQGDPRDVLILAMRTSYEYGRQAAAEIVEDHALMQLGLSPTDSGELHDIASPALPERADFAEQLFAALSSMGKVVRIAG